MKYICVQTRNLITLRGAGEGKGQANYSETEFCSMTHTNTHTHIKFALMPAICVAEKHITRAICFKALSYLCYGSIRSLSSFRPKSASALNETHIYHMYACTGIYTYVACCMHHTLYTYHFPASISFAPLSCAAALRVKYNIFACSYFLFILLFGHKRR